MNFLKKKWRRCNIDTIDELYKSVAAGLKVVKECKIYREDVPQSFTTPCFLVTLYNQNPSRGINGRLKNTINLDILYFPQNIGQAELQEECWKIGQDLAREFVVASFKIKNRNFKIEGNVLHFLFDVDYREFREDSSPQMQTMTQNKKIKEE